MAWHPPKKPALFTLPSFPCQTLFAVVDSLISQISRFDNGTIIFYHKTVLQFFARTKITVTINFKL